MSLMKSETVAHCSAAPCTLP